MYLSSLSLSGFRSFGHKRSFEFNPHYNLIFGKNSVGKTNLLEAIYYLNKGKGFRESKGEELIKEDGDTALIEGRFVNGTASTSHSIRLEKKGPVVKNFFHNQLKKDLKDYKKRAVPTVLFQPTDLDLIVGPPAVRRSFVDRILSDTDFQYFQAKTNYEKGLYKRNKILEHREKYPAGSLREVLDFWDNFLEKAASYLTQERGRLSAFMNDHPHLNGAEFAVEYLGSSFTKDRAREILDQELKYRKTLIGPQLDELAVYKMEGKRRKELSVYGSRSEQRLGVLWLKVNELQYYHQVFGRKPMLLMDDIFSELDLENSRKIMRVARDFQTFITTAHLEILSLIDFPVSTIELK